LGTVLEIDHEQAEVVLEIFTRYLEGLSCLAISRELNARGIASSGSAWRRRTRRCGGGMGYAARAVGSVLDWTDNREKDALDEAD
jgi:hypothetical protein